VNSGLYFRPPARRARALAHASSASSTSTRRVARRSPTRSSATSRVHRAGRRHRASECSAAAPPRSAGARRDPALDAYPAGGDAVTGQAPEHDPHLPAAGVRAPGARMLVDCRVDRLGAARSASSAETSRSPTAPRHHHLPARVRVRRCHPDAGAAAALGHPRHIGRTLAVHPTVKLAARFADEVNVPDDVPVHQVKEFAPDLSFGGFGQPPGPRRARALDQWATFQHAVTQWRTSACTTRRSPARAAAGCGVARHARPARHLPPHLARSRAAAQRPRPARAADARGRRQEVYPSFRVRRRCEPGDLATMQRAFAATKASVMTVHLCSTVPMGEDPGDRRRLVRPGARLHQRLRQRRLAAPHAHRASTRRHR
jgi:hypothetical protein